MKMGSEVEASFEVAQDSEGAYVKMIRNLYCIRHTGVGYEIQKELNRGVDMYSGTSADKMQSKVWLPLQVNHRPKNDHIANTRRRFANDWLTVTLNTYHKRS